METLLVVSGWSCLVTGFFLFVPLMILGSKAGYSIGAAIGGSLGRFFRSFVE